MRRGVRSAGAQTITYVTLTGEERPARFGFIVSKQVGTAVVRNTIRRRLKTICSEALPSVRMGADVVIRALPSSADNDYQSLRDEVRRSLEKKAS